MKFKSTYNKKFKLYFKNITYTIKQEKKMLFTSIALGFIFTILLAFSTSAYSNNIQSGISDQIIRFHVLANSDSEEDQLLKLKIRDKVLEEFGDILDSSENYNDAIKILNDNMDPIISLSKDIVLENGYDYDITASTTKSIFPTKQYGDVTLPAGEYDALRIIIGDGQGQNWWCVMFPPLCFVDITQEFVMPEAEQQLKNILTEEEYAIVMNKNTKDLSVKVKFKIVEWWQEVKATKVK